ncbi:Serine protease, subtilisin family [Pricia antarctica]|uniref:Serine protease, subtilisin family n=1 Tax=Pricia antarctica TaxID=641691 RepID=A0A1G7G9V9_9FLAO|nr:S8 family peptidase [Pricia antarctica]SDE84901.1 Serine protease, subtilisin family [Pricia antarctica]
MATKQSTKKIIDSPSGSPPELIVVSKSVEAPHAMEAMNAAKSKSKPPEDTLAGFVVGKKLQLVPLFGDTDAEVAEIVSRSSVLGGANDLSKMRQFYKVEAAADENLEKLAASLNKLDEVEGAYVKPGCMPPVYFGDDGTDDAPDSDDVPITQNLTNNQGYLNASPQGVDARYAWTLPGGRGNGVRIIDIEGGWNFSHEDLRTNVGGLLGGTNTTDDLRWYNHGTAVFGEMSGDSNSFGVTGISPSANVRAYSIFDGGSAAAIRQGADNLSVGDVMLIELHRPGPNYPGGNTQMGYIAIEWWPDDLAALQYATNKGIIVVEAAGNGSQNLDAAVYNTRPSGFPSSWRNPFRRGAGHDSGCVLVGAGAPPPGTNGGNWGVDRSRLGFSNYGSCIDTQGWGQGVTTCGYGNITGTDPNNKNEWYTHFFNGTSSASPIVTGTVACLQGIQKAAGRALLTPSRMRQLFRTTGSPQQAGANPVSQRIGNRPNLRALVAANASRQPWCGVQFTGSLPQQSTRRWFTHSWPDHWHVIWTVVPTAPAIDGSEQIEFKVKTTRQAFGLIKYFIEIKNLKNYPVSVEARFCVIAS